MAAKKLIYIFLSATMLLFAATGAKKGTNSRNSLLNRRNRFDPQGFSDYDSGSLNRCDKCGVRGGSQNPNLKIINGTDAEVGEFPWKCYERVTLDNGWWGVCTCNILSPEWVLVAAHCVHNLSVSRITISAGVYDLNRPELDNRDVVNVADYIVHEGWDMKSLVNDIALIRLERPLDFTRPGIEPVCVPYKFKGRTFEWQTVTASGYGMTKFAGPPQPILRKVDLQVVPIDACINWRRTDKEVPVTTNHICAYGMPVSASGVCHGDSGSSLDFRDPSTGRYYAIGITSWGFEPCSTKEFPNVFTDVTKYLDWIDYETGTHFCG